MFSNNNNGNRKLICSVLGGAIYSVGLWLLIDAGAYASVHHTYYHPMRWFWFLPFIFGSLAIIMINAFTAEDFRNQGLSDAQTKRARICFLVGFTTLILTMLGSFWIAIEQYFTHGDNDVKNGVYPGIALIVASICSILAAFVVRFGHW